jgi:hypothetical protein
MVGEVPDVWREVRWTASDPVADDVEVLDGSIADLDGAIADLGGDLTHENASAVGTAIDDVRASARTVLVTLGDC